MSVDNLTLSVLLEPLKHISITVLIASVLGSRSTSILEKLLVLVRKCRINVVVGHLNSFFSRSSRAYQEKICIFVYYILVYTKSIS